MGFPIRKSADQSFFAAPHGLSQRSTSFIASQRQGIHRVPLRHLIALIIDARHAFSVCVRRSARRPSPRPGRTPNEDKAAVIDLRKTSLLRDRPDGPAVKRGRHDTELRSRPKAFPKHDAGVARSAQTEPRGSARTNSGRSPLHDVGQHAPRPDGRVREKCFFLDEQSSSLGVAGLRRARSKAHQCAGGARRDRTDDLLLAKQALSQLSYGPKPIVTG